MMNRARLLLIAAALLSGPFVSAAGPETAPITVEATAKKMDAPPLDSDLSKPATLAVDGGAPIRPSSWTIRQTGHMGHHLRGRLVFPAEADGRPVLGPGAKSFELRLAAVQGEPQAVFPGAS